MTKVSIPGSTLRVDPSKRLKRGEIKRSTPMPRENRKRKQKRAVEGLVYGPYHRWIETLPCHIAGKHTCGGRIVGHHVKHVGNGGQDYGNEVPLCSDAHTDSGIAVHTQGPDSFDTMFNVDLKSEALRYATMWDEREGE